MPNAGAKLAIFFRCIILDADPLLCCFDHFTPDLIDCLDNPIKLLGCLRCGLLLFIVYFTEMTEIIKSQLQRPLCLRLSSSS